MNALVMFMESQIEGTSVIPFNPKKVLVFRNVASSMHQNV